MPIEDVAINQPNMGHPRGSLEHKLLLWTLALVIAPTLLCSWWLNHVTRQVMTEHYTRNVTIMSNALAMGFIGSQSNLEATAQQRIRSLVTDHRLAFVEITNPEGHALYRRVVDGQAWVQYREWCDAHATQSRTEVSAPIVLGDGDDVLVHRVPIWDPPLAENRAQTEGAVFRRQLKGYVLLAMREPMLPQMLSELRNMQFTYALVVCLLSLPLITWGVRSVTAPIRSLMTASLRLASGEEPEPVKARSHDEVGMLTEAFNFMAGRLINARHLLEKANEELEQKVAARTAELQRLNEQLEQTARQFETMAATDPLTGVANRRA
ncbi:MAG: HAMP domain-containing protein, partial [Phycisphaeraceae bacterium]|nr:HAMP domain-containing protein [Phycisphaeraceae bacterium]